MSYGWYHRTTRSTHVTTPMSKYIKRPPTRDFYVMRPEQYERFAAGGGPEVTSVVYRGEQWNARVGESLPPGDYYLVFDNYDSGGDAQTVAAEFFLVPEQQ